jgi:hypothetical protein
MKISLKGLEIKLWVIPKSQEIPIKKNSLVRRPSIISIYYEL